MKLNSAQQQAVFHRGSPLLVLAGAGTGKTRVITHRVAQLLEEGVYPWRILAVTFTNKAAAEMRTRIAKLCHDRNDISRLWVGTFHAISARILRLYGDAIGLSRNFAIYDTGDQESLMKQVLKELDISERMYSPRGLLSQLDRAKNQGFSAQELHRIGLSEPLLSVATKAATRYEERLRNADAVDFGDLLLRTVQLLQQAGQTKGAQLANTDPILKFKQQFSHIVVDEFQDTNPVQANLIDLLATQAELCVVGDDDQSIYGWRGADVAQILQFPAQHRGCEIIRLEQNYRSTSHILNCADAVISANQGRLGKKLWCELGNGTPVRVHVVMDERDEAKWIAQEVAQAIHEGESASEIAVFYRTHAQSRALEEAFRLMGIRYTVLGGLRFFDRKEIKDLLAYLRLLANPQSDVDFLRIINVPSRGIGAKTVERLLEYARAQGISLMQAVQTSGDMGLGSAGQRKLAHFGQIMQELQVFAQHANVEQVAEKVLDVTGYRENLSLDDRQEAQTRLENLQEFIGDLARFVSEEPQARLADYLEQVSLTSNVEGDLEAYEEAVALMTVHSAKGLEFTRVYLTGMEERVFPHVRAYDDPQQMEEERRLAYVAVTRAKRQLAISWARQRRLYGQVQVGKPSRFIGKLPQASAVLSHSPAAGFGSAFSVREQAKESWNHDIVYDDSELMAAVMDDTSTIADGHISLYVGMPVRHARFGRGELLGWSGQGEQLKFVLRFANHGTKTILARFCEIE